MTVAPFLYPQHTSKRSHPAIIEKDVFEIVQEEMRRRKTANERTIGNGRYTSKYPFSGLLICGICGHKLRRHVRRVGSGKMVAAWGCSHRILNGRAACDSHHVNEDTLQRTYLAAIREMIEEADKIITAVHDSARIVLQPENAAALAEVEQMIIKIQETALGLHRAKQAHQITDGEYTARISECTQRMRELEARQAELQTAASRYAEVKCWLDTFAEHIKSGDIMNADDDTIVKQLVEQIIVNDDGIEIQFKCGATIEKEYEAA